VKLICSTKTRKILYYSKQANLPTKCRKINPFDKINTKKNVLWCQKKFHPTESKFCIVVDSFKVLLLLFLSPSYTTPYINTFSKVNEVSFKIMGGHGNFAFNLIVRVSVELGYVFLSFR
jgi:hypothetical protein